MGERKKVFITGAAGRVGAALSEGLRNRYDLKLLYHPSRIPENRNEADDVVVSDMTDFDAMVEAAAGMDAIVHLALSKGRKGDTPLQRSRVTVDENIPGDFNIFEAARINSVPTIVYASTNHVSGRYENDGVLSRADAPVRPDGVYGAGKAFGEALGRFYSEGHGIRVLCLRIANCPGAGTDEPGKPYEPGFSRWLSNRDAAQLVWRCIETEEVQFGIFYGVSLGGENKFDLSNAREILGYEPEDDGSLAEYRNKYSS